MEREFISPHRHFMDIGGQIPPLRDRGADADERSGDTFVPIFGGSAAEETTGVSLRLMAGRDAGDRVEIRERFYRQGAKVAEERKVGFFASLGGKLLDEEKPLLGNGSGRDAPATDCGETPQPLSEEKDCAGVGSGAGDLLCGL